MRELFNWSSGNRFFGALYFSALIHFAILILVLSPLSESETAFCGYHILKLVPKEKPALEFEFGSSDQGNSSLEKGSQEKQSPPTGNPSGEEGKSLAENQGKIKEKYEGTEWKDLVENLEKTKDLRKNFKEDFQNNILQNGGATDRYIKRYRHYEDMVVKEVLPTLGSIDEPFSKNLDKADEVLEKHRERNEIIEKFRSGDGDEPIKLEIAKKKPNRSDIPLKMSEEEMNQYLDETLKNQKEEQMEEFRQKYAAGYDPDKGDLPKLFRELYYKNLRRIAYNFSPDPTYFAADYFEENLNKEDYLRNVMELVKKWKGTKTATEILFTIFDIYSIQERAVGEVLQMKTVLKNQNPADKNQIRSETIRRITEKYDPILAKKGIRTSADASRLYDTKKLEILNYILETSPEGYRKNDALFEKGRVLFEKSYRSNSQSFEEAIEVWKKIQPEKDKEFVFSGSHERLKEALKEIEKNPSSAGIIRMQVLNILQMREAESIEKKREREQRLLWGN